MNKREFIGTIGKGALAVGALKAFAITGVVGGIALLDACGPNLQVQFAIARQILGAISQTLANLNLPGPVALVTKAVAVINDIEKAYKAGKFTDALGFLNEIAASGGLFDQILADINVASNKQIKAFMLALQGALSVIAIILEAQRNNPAVAAALRTMSPSDKAKLTTLHRLADESRVDAALKSLRQVTEENQKREDEEVQSEINSLVVD